MVSAFHLRLDGFPIFIDRINGNFLSGHVTSVQSTRLSFLQHGDEILPVEQARNRSTYLFSLGPMGKFRIFMDLSEITQKPYISILVDTVDGKQSWYLNYRCPFSQLSCNSQKLTIQNIEDLQDGCAKVNIFFEGTGDVYLLSRLDGFDDPDTENVIREGIYLGKYIFSDYTKTKTFK